MINIHKLNTDARILMGSLIAIAVLSAISVLTAPAPNAPSLSIRSGKADGAMALQRWLERSGFRVQEVLSLEEQLPSLDVLFILEPFVPYSDGELRQIHEWVQNGNMLIVTGSPFSVNEILRQYEIALDYPVLDTEPIAAAAPTLFRPGFDAANVEIVYPIDSENADAVPHLFVGTLPVVMSLPVGTGEIWIFGVPVPFTNLGIRDVGNASLIANVLSRNRPNAVIGFDEAAHGYGDENALDFNGWLFGTAPGWGVLLAVAITMLYLALRGRHFGRPVPLPDDRLRRESGEYISAIATLFRRSGERSEMLKHYEGQLRRRLSERYALDPQLTTNELVKSVIYHDPTIEESYFRELLQRLQHSKISESELVRTISDVDTFLKQL